MRFKLYMRFLIFVAMISIFFCVKKQRKESNLHNVIDCSIFDLQGKLLWSLPGASRCVFYDDGSFIAAQDNQLVKYDKNLGIRWRIDSFNHHQINAHLNKLFVLSSEHIYDKMNLIRFDTLHIMDLDGKILNAFRVYDHKKFWLEDQSYWSVLQPYKLNGETVSKEFSHLNSFYVIPANTAEKENPAFAAGNYIVSDFRGKIFILDKNLKNILWEIRSIDGIQIRPHDAQVTPNGKIIFYFNYSKEIQNYTTLEEFDPLTSVRRVLYRGEPPESFFSPVKGGLQILDNGNILTSDNSPPARAFEISALTNKVIWSFQSGAYSDIQQIKRRDLSGFLGNNKGL